MTKSIPLTQGKFALVDDEDYKWLNQWKWGYHNGGYAVRHESRLLGRKMILMHRLIMNTPDGMQTDHINGDRLDNRRANLRNCTQAENNRNMKLISSNRSGYKGVWFRADRNRWTAQISVNDKTVHLGHYKNREDAARAYDKAAKEYYGDFAKLNLEEK